MTSLGIATIGLEESGHDAVHRWTIVSGLHVLPNGGGEANIGILSYALGVIKKLIRTIISFIKLLGEGSVLFVSNKAKGTSGEEKGGARGVHSA